jgi:hypothetical protein
LFSGAITDVLLSFKAELRGDNSYAIAWIDGFLLPDVNYLFEFSPKAGGLCEKARFRTGVLSFEIIDFSLLARNPLSIFLVFIAPDFWSVRFLFSLRMLFIAAPGVLGCWGSGDCYMGRNWRERVKCGCSMVFWVISLGGR